MMHISKTAVVLFALALAFSSFQQDFLSRYDKSGNYQLR